MSVTKNIFILLFTCGLYLLTQAQAPVEKLAQWQKENPIEKMYLHLDRKDYFPGQTCWFKGYFVSGILPSFNNSTLFIELTNGDGIIISKKVIPVFGGLSYGQIEIPDTVGTGTYHIRAYTPLMLNHDKSYVYNTAIRVYGRTSKLKEINSTISSLSFFPEGGTLLAGVENNIAFKATDSKGFPINISAIIKNNNNTAIAQIQSFHDGMGTFKLTPTLGETYIAVFNNNNIKLPMVSIKGLAVFLQPTAGKVNYSFKSLGGNEFIPDYIIGQMQHKIVIKQTIDNSSDGIINTANLPSGVLQFTFFNKDGIPLAERLVFINNKEYKLSAVLNTKKLSTQSRSLNQYSIDFENAVAGNFSISVTDDSYNEPGLRKENIITSLLLTSDIPGYVHNPGFYFSDNEDAQKSLDLLMLTNGWRRFKWENIIENKNGKPAYFDPGYISLSGKVHLRGSKKNFAEQDLMAWVATSDSGRALQMLRTDAEGRFRLDSLVFFDKAKILFSDIMGSKNKFITVKLDADSLYKSYQLPTLQMPSARNTNTALTGNMQTAYYNFSRGSGMLLDNVNIEGRRLTLEELEKRYTSGLFSGNINAKTINLTGQFVPQINIFEWLEGRIAGLYVQRTSPFLDKYMLYYRQQSVQLFLDEMQMQDADFISSIPASQIALIKIFPQFIGASGNNAAIAIYTKRGNDLNEEMEASGDIVDYNGYSIIKEFYSPNYSTPPDIDYTDNRLTLYWQPEIITTASQTSIPIQFYNTDRTKKFKIVAEGISKEGKLLMLEQTIE